MTKVLITGGAGFIGSQLGLHLTKQEDKYKIFLVDNFSYGYKENLSDGTIQLPCNDCDIRSKEFHKLVKDIKPNIVIHLAGIAPLPDCQTDPVNAFDNNVLGTINVIEACKDNNVSKIIFSSTSAIYENSEEPIFIEDVPLKTEPDLVYATTKRHCEHIINNYVTLYGMDITTLRFFNVWGLNQDYTRKQPPLIGYIIKCILNDQTPTFYSDGYQRRDYIFSTDLVNLIDIIIHTETTPGEIYNACSGNVYSVRDIYASFCKTFEFKRDPIFTDPGQYWDKYPEMFEGKYPLSKKRVHKEVNKISVGSNQKACQTFNWTPQVDLDTGVGLIHKHVS